MSCRMLLSRGDTRLSLPHKGTVENSWMTCASLFMVSTTFTQSFTKQSVFMFTQRNSWPSVPSSSTTDESVCSPSFTKCFHTFSCNGYCRLGTSTSLSNRLSSDQASQRLTIFMSSTNSKKKYRSTASHYALHSWTMRKLLTALSLSQSFMLSRTMESTRFTLI